MTNEKVSEEELARAKSQMKAGMLMSLENSSAVAEKLARQLLLFNRYMPVDEMVEYIEAVTADDILKTAQKYLQQNLLILWSVILMIISVTKK